MPGWTKVAVGTWARAPRISNGRVARAVNKGGPITHDSLSPNAISRLVVECGRQIAVDIGPHDLRRTFAKLAHKGNATLERIQLSLGHASIATTERYLGARQNLHDAPCDYLGLEVETHESKE